MGWGKVACWSPKVAIPLKHVKIEEKLLWRACRKSQRSFKRYHPRPPTASSSPRLGVRNPRPKPQSTIISGTDEATNLKFGRYIHRVYPKKSSLNILMKGKRGFIKGLPNFWVLPIISRKGEATKFKFGWNRVHQIKKPV